MKNKKASLSLSVNAIVVLVIGIVVLGLALGFTRGMFGTLSQSLTIPEPNYPATADEPIVLPQETVDAKASKDLIMTINFYNDYATDTWTPNLVCEGLSLIENDEVSYLTTAQQAVEAGEYKGFKFIISKEAFSKSGYYLCTVSFSDTTHTVTKQIALNVQ